MLINVLESQAQTTCIIGSKNICVSEDHKRFRIIGFQTVSCHWLTNIFVLPSIASHWLKTVPGSMMYKHFLITIAQTFSLKVHTNVPSYHLITNVIMSLTKTTNFHHGTTSFPRSLARKRSRTNGPHTVLGHSHANLL